MKAKEVLAYTAGIIDGEGSIQIIRSHDSAYRLGFRYESKVSVGSTDEWLCRWLKMQFGGYISSFEGRKANWKRSWVWYLRDRRTIPFLKSILPYLQLKRGKAELLIQFQSINPLGIKSGVSKAEAQVLKEADYILMKSLNKRGVEIA